MTQTDSNKLFEKAVCYVVSFSRMGTRKKVSTADVDIRKQMSSSSDQEPQGDADKSMLHLSKDILVCDEFKAVTKLDTEIRAYIKKVALPSPLFRGGVFMIPVLMIEAVDAWVQGKIAERQILVDAAVDVYPKKVDEAREKLGSLFVETDYPTVDRVRRAFDIVTQIITFSTPTTLKNVSRELFEREAKKAEARVAEATDEIVKVLRESFKGLIDHMVDRLRSDSSDGKQKIFKSSMVANMVDFLGTFRARNIADDEELGKLVEQAQQIMQGVTPDALRENTTTREYVANSMAKIQETLDTLVETRGRVVRDDDEV